MIQIHTIADWLQLQPEQKVELQKALRVKHRLETWLARLSNVPPTPEHTSVCLHCGGEGSIWLSPRDNSDIHPSGIMRCLKRLFYDCTDYVTHAQERVDSRLRMIFDLGHAIHAMMQDYGKRGAWGNPNDYHPEVPINGTINPIADDLWIRGAADAVVQDYLPNVPLLGDVSVRIVHEYKSIRTDEYQQLRAPKPEHKWQATIYARTLNIPLVVYLYVDKNTCLMADFPVPFDLGLWESIEQRIRAVQFYVAPFNTAMDQGVPIEECPLPGWEVTAAELNPYECQSCKYKHICNPPKKMGVRRQ